MFSGLKFHHRTRIKPRLANLVTFPLVGRMARYWQISDTRRGYTDPVTTLSALKFISSLSDIKWHKSVFLRCKARLMRAVVLAVVLGKHPPSSPSAIQLSFYRFDMVRLVLLGGLRGCMTWRYSVTTAVARSTHNAVLHRAQRRVSALDEMLLQETLTD